MTNGIGGSTPEIELAKLSDMTGDISPIELAEYTQYITRAQHLMQQQGIAALYINAGTNLTYFTGTKWPASERMVGAIIPAPGMCFSNEPMICIYGHFGMRHENHFYITQKGPKWFTEPAHTIDDPFGYS